MKQRAIRVPVIAVLSISLLLPACGNPEANRRKEIAAKECSIVKQIVGIDLLASFQRKRGVFRIRHDPRKWTTVTVGHAQVTMPTLEHREVTEFHKPFEGIRYHDRRNHITVSIYTERHDARKYLRETTTPELFRKYGYQPLFSYLEEALGVYTDGYCDTGNPEKSIAMFMARSATALPHGATDIVYQLNQPRALLVVPATLKPMTGATILLPARDPDAVTYELIVGPTRFIASLVRSLSRQ
ncbi:hypothetical protein [Petrachloros mirabilis]